jgi:predicted ATPase/transcriptional regulator with XRE-family HTH domain
VSSFADVLRELRTARSLTQEELAERAGITAKAVSALERGDRRRPYPHTVRSLADALGLEGGERERLVGAVPGRTTTGRAVAALPAPQGAVLGRDADVDAVSGLVAERVRRLVTLTGPGGVGKTTLALVVAARVADRFSGGVTLVDVAALRDPDAVLPAVATALGVPEGGYAGTGASLAPYLEHRHVLLVLDNLEQVVDCAPQVAELVTSCPDLCVLATSRAPLRVRPEREYRVAPLGQHDALRLFLERADAAGADLGAPDQAGPVAALCQETEGLPLAIELAASAASSLGPAALLARLGSLVTEGPRDLPPRQRSIEATLDWSVELLPPPARALLGALSVVPASFTPAAAEAVGGPGALSGVHTLLEHSLLTRVDDVDGVPRYRLLEPVRQYAVHRWPQEGAAAARRGLGAHAWETALARGRQLRADQQAGALDFLDAELANQTAGLRSLVDHGRHDDAADLLRHGWLHLALRGHTRDGQAWLARVRGLPMSDRGRASWMVAHAGLCHLAGDTDDLRRTSEAARDLARLAGDDLLLLEAAVLGGFGAVFAGDHDAAAALVRDHADLLASSGDGYVRTHFGIVDGQIALLSGDLPGAEHRLLEAESMARTLGNPFTLAVVLNVLATVSELREDHATSAVRLGEATELSADASLSWSLAYSLPALAGVAVRVGEVAAGARLFGASASYAARHGIATTFQASRDLAARDLADARDRLGEPAFRREWDAGRAATIEEVGELASDVTRRARA